MTFAVVQDTAGATNFTPTLGISFSSAVTATHGLTLEIGVNLAGGITSVTSSNGDTWARLVQALNTTSSNKLASEIWYCLSSAGGSSTVTITASGTSSITKWDMTEWSAGFGSAGSSQHATGGTTAWSLSGVTAGSTDLTLFTMSNNDSVSTGAPPSGFTALAANSGSFAGFIEFGYLAGAATTAASGTISGTDGWASVIGVLHPAGTNGGFTGVVGTASADGIVGSFSGGGSTTGVVGTATADGIAGSFSGGGGASTVTQTTLDDLQITFASNFAASGSAYTMGPYTVPDGDSIRIVSGSNDNSVLTLDVSDTGSRTWTRLAGYEPNSMPLAVDWWHNDTGSPVSISPTLTPTYGFNKTIGVGVYLISGAQSTPTMVATVVDGTIPESSGTPSAVGSLMTIDYVQQLPSAIVSGFDTGTTGDTSPVGYDVGNSGSDEMGLGSLYQSAPNTQTSTPVTVGATAPPTDTWAVLLEHIPASSSVGGGFTGVVGEATADGIPGSFQGTAFIGVVGTATADGIPGTFDGYTVVTGTEGTATAAGIPGTFAGTAAQSGQVGTIRLSAYSAGPPVLLTKTGAATLSSYSTGDMSTSEYATEPISTKWLGA